MPIADQNPVLQPVLGFHRCRGCKRPGRHRPAERYSRRHRESQQKIYGRTVPAVSPATGLVGDATALDRARAQAWKDRRSQPVSAGQRGSRHQSDGDLPLRCGTSSQPMRDTQLPPGTMQARWVATLAHPLNRPVLDPATKVRRRGFTIIQPRVSIGLPGATATRFTRIFADTTGTDPYTRTVSDAQQDLFGQAIFRDGKAIYDLAAFDASVGDRFPAETLLSHDLIEGSYAGVGLATDIELFENMPLDYAAFCKRQHRWIRGDWQIARWISRRVPTADRSLARNPLSAISRWRILDNLRRSLVPIASMLLLILGWIISPAPAAWSLVVGLAIAIPALAPLLDQLVRRIQGSVLGWQGAHNESMRALVLIAFLPHQAMLAADAIWKVAYRRMVSGRHLLEWQTAERAASDSRAHLTSTMRQTDLHQCLFVGGDPVPGFAESVCAGLPVCRTLDRIPRPVVLALAAGFQRCPQTPPAGKPPTTPWTRPPDLALFRRCGGPDTNWLPPDSTQVALNVEVAGTSPTNIGLWLSLRPRRAGLRLSLRR